MASDHDIYKEMHRLQQAAEKNDRKSKLALENYRLSSTPAQASNNLDKAKKFETERDNCIAEREVWKKQLSQKDERQREMLSSSKQDIENERIRAKAKAKANINIYKSSKDSAQLIEPNKRKDTKRITSAEQKMKEKLNIDSNKSIHITSKEATLTRGEELMKKKLDHETAIAKEFNQRNQHDR
jgi:hypothetical protein